MRRPDRLGFFGRAWVRFYSQRANRVYVWVYLVLGVADCRHHPLMDIVEQALDGGVSAIQLREKQVCEDAFVALARDVHRLTYRRGVPLLINDRVNVARRVGAEGVHLGQDDGHPLVARHCLGQDAWIGLSISRWSDMARVDGNVDYLGVGPVFATFTKQDAASPMGVGTLKAIVEKSNLPCVAIGGIGRQNLPAITRHCGCGVAVVSALCGARDPKQETMLLRAMMSEGVLV